MPENSSSRNVTAGKTREHSTREPSSSASASKRRKLSKLRILARAFGLKMKVGPQLRLCSYCTNAGIGEQTDSFIDLTDSFIDLTKDHLGYMFENMDTPNCDSCELIGNAMPVDTLSEFTEENLPYLSRLRWNKIEVVKGTRLYGILHIDADDNDLPNTIPKTINFNAFRAWLDNCKKVHGTSCEQRDLSIRHSSPVDVILVDVIRNCVIKKTTASRYFALSYVWGGANTTTTTMQNLAAFKSPGSLEGNLVLPKTVSDAMLLTRKMGVRYLWVDCLSIIQDSPEKHWDIINMDVIFSQAELTIVAADGRDATSGLPGLQQGTRRQTVMSKIQEHHILKLELPYEKNNLLKGTVYGTRGWTFQELLLSKRVLFVTEHQVTFHCETSWRSESSPREQSHCVESVGVDTISFRRNESYLRSTDYLLYSYSTMVSEYCKKRLSFQTDIENAFSGLASILEDWCDGCPVINGMLSSFFGHSMIWAFQVRQSLYSSYCEAERGKRREKFPSWSWVGWVASISNINSISGVELPLLSLMRNIEITTYGKQSAESLSLTVLDKSVKEDYTGVTGQQICIHMKPANSDSISISPQTLGFDAEQTEWKNFTVKRPATPGPVVFFGLSGRSSECGVLSIAPDEGICHEVFNQAALAVPEVECNWSLVQLYQLQLYLWDSIQDNLQLLLSEIEYSGAAETGFARKFRRRLEHSKLLYVLLIRRHGLYWERVGSGLMFGEDWPSTSKQAEVRAYHERIVLI